MRRARWLLDGTQRPGFDLRERRAAGAAQGTAYALLCFATEAARLEEEREVEIASRPQNAESRLGGDPGLYANELLGGLQLAEPDRGARRVVRDHCTVDAISM